MSSFAQFTHSEIRLNRRDFVRLRIGIIFLILVYVDAAIAASTEGFKAPNHWIEVTASKDAKTDSRTYRLDNSAVVLVVSRKFDSKKQKSEIRNLKIC